MNPSLSCPLRDAFVKERALPSADSVYGVNTGKRGTCPQFLPHARQGRACVTQYT